MSNSYVGFKARARTPLNNLPMQLYLLDKRFRPLMEGRLLTFDLGDSITTDPGIHSSVELVI